MVNSSLIRNEERQDAPFKSGITLSLALHFVLAFAVLAAIERNAANAMKPQEVFSVTLEGGDTLGGISQSPEPEVEKRKKALPPKKVDEQPKRDEAEKKARAEKKRKAQIVAKKRAEERAKKAAEEKRKKKVAEERERKKKAEAKRKAEEARVKEKRAQERERQAKVRAREEKEARDKQFQQALERARTQYRGESARAGGEGFGAARLGGSAMGGGSIRTPEFIAYLNTLESHIKRNWHWLPGTQVLVTRVVVRLLPDGKVSEATVDSSSGNSKFDSSAIRAVYKSSPVPPPPPNLYQQFREIRFTFDSRDEN